MAENLMVLVIFFFLIVIALVFYLNIEKRNIDFDKRDKQKIGTVNIKNLVSAMPQLQCSQAKVSKSSCIDMLNAKVMASYWQEIKDEYSPEWDYFNQKLGYLDISIHVLDPITGLWEDSLIIYSNKPDTTIYDQVYTPISLYNSTSNVVNDYSFGVLEIKVYYLE